MDLVLIFKWENLFNLQTQWASKVFVTVSLHVSKVRNGTTLYDK